MAESRLGSPPPVRLRPQGPAASGARLHHRHCSASPPAARDWSDSEQAGRGRETHGGPGGGGGPMALRAWLRLTGRWVGAALSMLGMDSLRRWLRYTVSTRPLFFWGGSASSRGSSDDSESPTRPTDTKLWKRTRVCSDSAVRCGARCFAIALVPQDCMRQP